MTDDEIDTERRYERVLHRIETSSGGPQPPGTLPRSVYQTLAKPHGEYAAEDIKKTIRAAINSGDVIVCRDRESQKRPTRTLDEDLRELIGHENAQEYPTIDLIEQAARHIDDLEASDA